MASSDNKNIAINLSDSASEHDDDKLNGEVGSDEEGGLSLANQIKNKSNFKSKNIFSSDVKQNNGR